MRISCCGSWIACLRNDTWKVRERRVWGRTLIYPGLCLCVCVCAIRGQYSSFADISVEQCNLWPLTWFRLASGAPLGLTRSRVGARHVIKHRRWYFEDTGRDPFPIVSASVTWSLCLDLTVPITVASSVITWLYCRSRALDTLPVTWPRGLCSHQYRSYGDLMYAFITTISSAKFFIKIGLNVLRIKVHGATRGDQGRPGANAHCRRLLGFGFKSCPNQKRFSSPIWP